MRCSGLGERSADSVRSRLPSKLNAGCDHSPRVIRIASSRPVTFSAAVGTRSPNARNSSSEEPPPSPRISRPPESRSSVSAIFATMAGGRYGTPSTRVATRIRVVAAATQDSSVQVSYVGRVPHGWSEGATKSKPSSSARRASATGSLPGAAEVERLRPNSSVLMWVPFREPRGPSRQAPAEMRSPPVRQPRDRGIRAAINHSGTYQTGIEAFEQQSTIRALTGLDRRSRAH